VESVAWIAERKDVLSAFFWMLTLCLYVYYTEKPAIRRYLLVLFSFVCALMSKPMVVTLPLIMILLDYWPLKRFESKKENWVLWQFKEKFPLFTLSAVFSIITLLAQHKMSAQDFPLASRLANAPIAFVTYLEKTFRPHDLAVFYPFPHQLPLGQILSAALLIIFISAFVIVMMKRLPYLFVGWFWFAIAMAPVIGIIQINPQAMADRYHYLPSIGIAIGLAWGLPFLINSADFRKKILFPAGIIFLVILAILTWQQCRYWENGITLFGRALHVTKNNYVAYCQFGYATVAEGKIAEAIEIYNEAIRLKPDYVYAYNNRGNAYAKLDQYQRAIDDYNESIRLSLVGYAQTYINRGNAYAQLGQYQRAIDDYNQALRLKPDDAYAYYNRGTIYHKLGQEQRAVEDLSKAIRLNPDYADAYYNRAIVYLSRGDNISGCNDALKACESGICQILESAKIRGSCR
jgi:tetratricopeptide (TPR) repeat protein